ncbi:MAG: RluA family pseudouridine synthase [Alphaproteobacteria bacterium]|nr:RluA family pseudouridine synthase [Alphaproteobacteria bacterium]
MSAVRVVYEDRWLLVVDKPSGLPTQQAVGGGDHLLHRLRDRPYVGLHHRLDAPVSGLVLLTVDREANAAVARAFQGHEIRRTYLAVASGAVRATRWDRPVDGKPAATEVEVRAVARGTSSLVLRPQTGRKHQLRVHAALAGHPLLGDRQYGEALGRAWPRIALHATELALTHPMTGEPLTLSSPLPPDLEPLWARFLAT